MIFFLTILALVGLNLYALLRFGYKIALVVFLSLIFINPVNWIATRLTGDRLITPPLNEHVLAAAIDGGIHSVSHRFETYKVLISVRGEIYNASGVEINGVKISCRVQTKWFGDSELLVGSIPFGHPVSKGSAIFSGEIGDIFGDFEKGYPIYFCRISGFLR